MSGRSARSWRQTRQTADSISWRSITIHSSCVELFLPTILTRTNRRHTPSIHSRPPTARSFCQSEEDFAQIAGAGLNWIRLPIPFWAIDVWPGEPFLERTCWTYILRAFQWARKYGLRVMLDLHTAPGSQNGAPKLLVSSPRYRVASFKFDLIECQLH